MANIEVKNIGQDLINVKINGESVGLTIYKAYMVRKSLSNLINTREWYSAALIKWDFENESLLTVEDVKTLRDKLSDALKKVIYVIHEGKDLNNLNLMVVNTCLTDEEVYALRDVIVEFAERLKNGDLC